MHQQLIEVLRAEASVVARRHYASTDNKNARLIDIADALANVAARLEGGGNCAGIGAEPDAESISDDDEPLTAEWLRNVMPEVMGVGSECWLVVDRNDPPLLWLEAGSHRKSLDVATRGEYRSLRKILGIPMEGVEE